MKRTKQNLSNYKLTTCDMGQLVPVQLQEILPGDSMKINTSSLIRVSPLLAPVMHPCTVRFHHWFVPTRLLWKDWEKFITGGENNDDASTIPTINSGDGFQAGGVMDNLGVPPGVADLNVSVLPVRAFNLIYNEFYRDQDLCGERVDANDALPKVAWRKDYFTTARPWTQKGDDIMIPLGSDAPVIAIGNGVPQFTVDGAEGNGVSMLANGSGAEDPRNMLTSDDLSAEQKPLKWHETKLVADLSESTGISANEFRELFALQRYAEARAQYGSRYSEYLRYLGVTPSDARLQRPEYLGGGKSTLQFSEVVQTGAGDDTQVGQLKGHGISAMRTRNTKKFFEEHGYMITVMSVVPKSIYQDGVQRTYLRRDKEDFYQRELASIGQQAILQGELDASIPTATRDTFGYSDRYADYRSTPSTISGEFRDTLDFWHLARKFETPPLLNSSFIECTPSKRIHAVQSNHTLWCMVNNSVIARRMVGNVTIGKLS